jgi:hypothetical protein
MAVWFFVFLFGTLRGMKIELDVPEIKCCRCGATAVIVPAAIKRGQGPDAIIDSAGGSWVLAGLPMPTGWSEPAPGKKLCPSCSKAYADGVSKLLDPAIATTPAGHAPLPPGAQRMIQSLPNAGRVTSGPIAHHAAPASRPAVTSAPPPAPPVRPATAMTSPQRPQAPQHAPQRSLPVVAQQMVHPSAMPPAKSSGVVVNTNTAYPSTEGVKTSPIPGALAPAELAPLPNEALEPQLPATEKRAS